MGFLCVWDQISVTIFARKDISWRMRKPNAKQNRFQLVKIFFYLFLQHISKTLCHLCSRRFWQITFSTDPWLSWADPERGTEGPDPLEKSQKFRVSKQYWSRYPEKSPRQSQHSMLGHYRPASETPFKWRFAGGPMMARIKWYFDPPSPHQLK